MVIRVVDLAIAADTEAQGDAVFARIRDALRRDDTVVVSFGSIHTATSSFVNAAFVPLLRDFTFSDLKRRMRVVDSSKQINEMLKRRLEREALAVAA